MWHAVLFFAGQVLINNCDIVLVKHFFSPSDAGIYAAIAMVGRVIFSCASAIVNSMFPVVAGSAAEDRKTFSLLGTTFLLVLSMGTVFAVVLRLTPSSVWSLLFGAGFAIGGPHGFSQLLSIYACSTIVYCLSVVVITYEMSYKIANTNWFQLAFSVILIGGISRYHSSLHQVILVQLVLSSGFLIFIGATFVYGIRADTTRANNHRLRLIRPVEEDEVIAGFLQSEFDHPVYENYRGAFREIVFHPDFDDQKACKTRRALLALRHKALWNELPRDTQWYEVEIQMVDLDRLRVFPRAQWVRAARGQYQIKSVSKRIGRSMVGSNEPFYRKIARLRETISNDQLLPGPVILIGINDLDPLTVLDGNHRLVAGVLENRIDTLRFVCGLSPEMTQCCWYKTSVPNLVRYGRNLLRAVGTSHEISALHPGTLAKEPSQSVS